MKSLPWDEYQGKTHPISARNGPIMDSGADRRGRGDSSFPPPFLAGTSSPHSVVADARLLVAVHDALVDLYVDVRLCLQDGEHPAEGVQVAERAVAARPRQGGRDLERRRAARPDLRGGGLQPLPVVLQQLVHPG